MVAYQCNRDFLRKIDHICLKSLRKLIFGGISIDENKVLSTKTFDEQLNFLYLVKKLIKVRKGSG